MTPQEPGWLLPIVIVAGAIPGALGRYYLTVLCARWLGSDFPFGTLLINLSGAFFMGWVATEIQELVEAPWLSRLLLTGFLGAYTTFATYVLDFANLMRNRSWSPALLYGLGSPIGGLMAVEAGIFLGQHW